MEDYPATPSEIVVDMNKTTRALIATPGIKAALPGVIEAFKESDRPFEESPESYLANLKNSVYSFKSHLGEVDCSLLYDDNSSQTEILLIFSPFSDVAPASSPQEMFHYVQQGFSRKPSFLEIQKAQPNSWNQITKSACIFELLSALGNGIPVLTVFSPIPPRAYTLAERQRFTEGDFWPAYQIALKAIEKAQDIMHGPNSETQISGVHLSGDSLGASNAIGSATEIMHSSDKLQILSVKAQELIIGKKFLQLAKGFMLSKQVGETSDISIPENFPRIPEPALRRAIDAYGNELWLVPRMLNAMSKLSYLVGLTRSARIVQDLETLLAYDVPITVGLAKNSGITDETSSFLPPKEESGLNLINIEAVAGQKIDHLADEHVALVGVMNALATRRAK